jgi:hypothetical protein
MQRLCNAFEPPMCRLCNGSLRRRYNLVAYLLDPASKVDIKSGKEGYWKFSMVHGKFITDQETFFLVHNEST